MSKQLTTAQPINIIVNANLLQISTLEIAQHILAGSKQKTVGAVNKDLVKIIKSHLDGFKELGQVGFQTHPVYQGGDTEYILLNEPQTNLLFMSMRNINPLVWRFKLDLIKRFDEMKRFIQGQHNAEWIAERATGKIYTKHIGELFTKALDVCGKSHKPSRYINLQQTIYKAVLGKTAQLLRKERDIPKGAIIRNFLTASELEDINAVQKIVERAFIGRSIDNDEQLTTAIYNAANAIKIPFEALIFNSREVA
ncbi:MAG: hypothetical protein K2Y14_09210 [Burkholderiales bacterium]|nr:hypothetical protein [Burkholderiales bacterium]